MNEPNMEWEEEFRGYFDKTLKSKKPSMKNLDRELLVSFIRSKIASAVEKDRRRIADEVKKQMPHPLIEVTEVLSLINDNK